MGMSGRLKLVSTIVDTKRKLIGFVLEGKEKDFGGFGDAKVRRPVPVPSLISSKFSNKQIGVSGGKLVERSDFRINSLPMMVYTGSKDPENEYVSIDNKVEIIKRYVQDNENVGFRIRYADGSEDDFQYANVIMLCKWFKPGNFSIRSSSKGNMYIAGKAGTSLADIPAVNIGKEPVAPTKRMKSAAKAPVSKFTGTMESGFDILDIYEFIDRCNGSIIKLPSETYEAASEGGETVVEGFTSLGIGEVASPRPMFNATKLNVNAGFKKVGVVDFEVYGNKTQLTTFVYRTKSIFLKGENYIKKFGIAVSTDKEEELLNTLGKSLALEKITDPSVIQPLSQVIDAKALAFYKVDTSKVDLISASKRKASIINAKQLAALCKAQYELKLISKAVGPKGGLMKDLKDSIGADKIAESKGKRPFGVFAMMSPDALNAITALGIDIYTGAFTKAGTPVAKKSDSKGDKDSLVDDNVEIEYLYEGFDAGKVTGKKVIQLVESGDEAFITNTVREYVGAVLKESDPVARYHAASEVYSKAEKKLEEISKKFWMHNASMYLEGNKTNIHTADKSKWVIDESTRVKTAQVYKYIGKDAEGLKVKFKGVNI